MKDAFINRSFNFINQHKELDDYNQIKIKYGLEVMYNFVVKTLVIMIIAIIFQSFFEVLYVFLFYGLLRTFIHGAHGRSNLICWILTLISYTAGIFLIKNYDISIQIKYVICFISLISMILFAPSDTKYRPLVNKQKRIKFKIYSILITITYSYITIFTNFKYRNCIIIALILSNIIINPLTYKLLKLTRNNYKNI